MQISCKYCIKSFRHLIFYRPYDFSTYIANYCLYFADISDMTNMNRPIFLILTNTVLRF